MFCKVETAAIAGIEIRGVTVEANASEGLPMLEMIGMLSGEVKEARERVRNALMSSGIRIPPKRITINLAPADLPKSGTGFDLAVAAALLVCLGILPEESVPGKMFFGELGLDGSIRRIRGVLPMVCYAKEHGMNACYVPEENAAEGGLIQGIRVIPVHSFSQFIRIMKMEEEPADPPVREETALSDEAVPDFSDVHGQLFLKRAAMIAAAGGHNLMIVGPPGSGKSMTAKRIAGILPPMTWEESLEVTKIYSIAGLMDERPLIRTRPFRAPHHTITSKGMAGGGRMPKPGEITLAQNGVLFLDETPEFSRSVIEVLRQPLEDKTVSISRVDGNYTFPANFILVCSANLCPCGFWPDLSRCSCTEYERKKYFGKLGGPFLDRIDLRAQASPLTFEDLGRTSEPELDSATMRKQVTAVREVQTARYKGTPFRCNSDLTPSAVKTFCELGSAEETLASQMFEMWNLSARSYYKLLKVARTIADLEGQENIRTDHLLEAGAYRCAET
ncbi:MAG: YifB family Mg chelatase-like AAA ATPase [Lachnospiraceae bacterium]|nr:YifB family Mg chelatase-like AAA ATPase [Lachnospiraceae bacterium]